MNLEALSITLMLNRTLLSSHQRASSVTLTQTQCFITLYMCTLFFKRSAHWFHQVLPVTLGHWPWSRVMSILSNDLDSKWPEVGVGDLGTLENEGGFHVHLFWRRVYYHQTDSNPDCEQAITPFQSVTRLLHCNLPLPPRILTLTPPLNRSVLHSL